MKNDESQYAIMHTIAEVLNDPPLRKYSTSDPVFLTCISVSHLARHLNPSTKHVLTISERTNPLHIAVVRSIHPVWNRVSENLSLSSSLVPFDPETVYNAPRTLFKLIDVFARKVQMTCLRCKRTYACESNCRSCLRSHRFEFESYPTPADIMSIWEAMPIDKRLGLCRALPPTSNAIDVRVRLAGSVPSPPDTLLRIVRGDTATLGAISGRELVQCLNTALEGGFRRVQNYSMRDFECVYDQGDLKAYIATLLLKNLNTAAKFVRDAVKIRDAAEAETELRRSEDDAIKAAVAKKARLALKKKAKAASKNAAHIETSHQNQTENVDANADTTKTKTKTHPIYAQLAMPCAFLSGIARCLLESVDGDASKLIVWDPVPRQPGGFDPVAAEKIMRRRAAMRMDYFVE